MTCFSRFLKYIFPTCVAFILQVDAIEVEGLNDAVANVHVDDDLAAAASAVSGSPTDVEVALVLGGMDTGGEIFDDCLVFRLSQTM